MCLMCAAHAKRSKVIIWRSFCSVNTQILNPIIDIWKTHVFKNLFTRHENFCRGVMLRFKFCFNQQIDSHADFYTSTFSYNLQSELVDWHLRSFHQMYDDAGIMKPNVYSSSLVSLSVFNFFIESSDLAIACMLILRTIHILIG